MLSFIEKLRAKPEKTRARVAFLVSFAFAGLLFVVWLSVIWPEWNATHNRKVAQVPEPTPIETLSSTFGTAADILSNQVSGIKAVISNIATTSEAREGTTTTEGGGEVGSSTTNVSTEETSQTR